MEYQTTVITVRFEDGSIMEWRHDFESEPVHIIDTITTLVNEDAELQANMRAGDTHYDPASYYGSVQHADDDPHGHHLMFDVI